MANFPYDFPFYFHGVEPTIRDTSAPVGLRSVWGSFSLGFPYTFPFAFEGLESFARDIVTATLRQLPAWGDSGLYFPYDFPILLTTPKSLRDISAPTIRSSH